MKIRKGFVSNSSSSSFVCSACDGIESGMDLGLDEVYMTECINGHIFHDDHISKDVYVEDRYECPVESCPCCQLIYIPQDAAMSYLLREKGMTRKEVDTEIRNRYGNMEEFNKDVNK